MARARNIKPGFFKNEDLAECSLAARLCFAGLWTLADREGRLEDRPKRIKGELFAFDSIEVEPLLVELAEHGFILRYLGDGGRFIQVQNFTKHQNPHQRESRSEIPPPEGAANKFNHDPVTPEQRLRILERDGYTCKHCASTVSLQVDHIIARARGGTSEDSNLQILCAACNIKKCAKDEPRLVVIGDTSAIRQIQGIAKDAPDGQKADMAGGGSRAEPLNPDSLIPDSLIGDKDVPPPAKPARASPPVFEGDANLNAIPPRALVQLAAPWELPEQWGIDAEALGWQTKEILFEAEKFRQYFVAGRGAGTRRNLKGWRQSWSNWLGKAASERQRA